MMEHREKIQFAIKLNSRSYGGFNTSTDDKIVIADININEYKLRKYNTKIEPKIDISGFSEPNKQETYKDVTKDITVNANFDPQEKWKSIVDQCKTVSEQVLGKNSKELNSITQSSTISRKLN